MTEAFQDLDDAESTGGNMMFVQAPGSDYQMVVKADKALIQKSEPESELAPTPAPPPVVTEFNNPPTPKSEVPMNPCTDPNMGAPSAATKSKASCTLKKPPRCYKLQQRFLQIQGGVADERDELMETIEKLQNSCEETRNVLQTSIGNDESFWIISD